MKLVEVDMDEKIENVNIKPETLEKKEDIALKIKEAFMRRLYQSKAEIKLTPI